MPLYEPFINDAYFQGELTLGQLDYQSMSDELKLFIIKYEREFLMALLGRPLYEAFYTESQTDPLPARWVPFSYGKTFLLDVQKVKTGTHIDALGRYCQIPDCQFYDKMQLVYNGLLKGEESNANIDLLSNSSYGYDSPIAKYIYINWEHAHKTHTMGVGEVAATSSNGHVTTNVYKVNQVMNDLKKDVENFYFFLDMNITNYPEFNLEPNNRLFLKTSNVHGLL